MSRQPRHLEYCAINDTDIDQEQLCSCGAYDRWREELRKEGWRKLPSAQEKDGKLIANGLSWVYVGRDIYIKSNEEEAIYAAYLGICVLRTMCKKAKLAMAEQRAKDLMLELDNAFPGLAGRAALREIPSNA